jgi:hypothetical protein
MHEADPFSKCFNHMYVNMLPRFWVANKYLPVILTAHVKGTANPGDVR